MVFVMMVSYKGEPLRWVSDFHGEPVLWITSPRQRTMELMKFVGGCPNEYCIFVCDILPVDYQYLIPNLSKQSDLHFLYFAKHGKYGYSFVCSEKIEDGWKDGYYTIGEDGLLVKQGEAR